MVLGRRDRKAWTEGCSTGQLSLCSCYFSRRPHYPCRPRRWVSFLDRAGLPVIYILRLYTFMQ